MIACISRALEQLIALGALEGSGNLTELGEGLAKLPVEPTMGKVLLTAVKNECIPAALAALAMDATDSVFSTSRCALLADRKRSLHLTLCDKQVGAARAGLWAISYTVFEAILLAWLDV